jgi:hypothetical protein
VSAPRIREGATAVSGRLPPEVIQRIVRQNFGRFRVCYENGLRARADLHGRVTVRFVIDATGSVASAADGGSDLPDPGVVSCVVSAFRNVGFPAPEGGTVTVVYPILFAPGAAPVGVEQQVAQAHGDDDGTGAAAPYAGRFADVMHAVNAHDAKTALAQAAAWRTEQPGDVLALVALGEALEASGDAAQASRAYGSLIDLFPSRADLRRFAGERLERVRDEASLDVAIDTYAKAEEERPDHPSSHRLLAFALLKRGRLAQAFDAAVAGLAHPYPSGRFPGVDRISTSTTPLATTPSTGRRTWHRAAISTPTSPPDTGPSASPSAAGAHIAPAPTGCRRTTTPADRWATEWGRSRSSSTTAAAA